jgi:hypothetical protein
VFEEVADGGGDVGIVLDQQDLLPVRHALLVRPSAVSGLAHGTIPAMS